MQNLRHIAFVILLLGTLSGCEIFSGKPSAAPILPTISVSKKVSATFPPPEASPALTATVTPAPTGLPCGCSFPCASDSRNFQVKWNRPAFSSPYSMAIPVQWMTIREEDPTHIWLDHGVVDFWDDCLDVHRLDLKSGEITTIAEDQITPSPTLLSKDSADSIESSSGKYQLVCNDQGQSQVFKDGIKQEFDREYAIDCREAAWDAGENHLAFIDRKDGDNAYLISMQKGSAISLGQAYSILWSKDGKYLRTVGGGGVDQEGYTINLIRVFDESGNKQGSFTVKGNLSEDMVYWVNDAVLDVQFRDGTEGRLHNYYFWSNGQPRGMWYQNLFPLFHGPQNAIISPDKNWMVMDETNIFTSTNVPSDKLRYRAYSFAGAKEWTLSEGSGRYIQFLEWRANNLFDLINRPTTPASLTDPAMPFGWLEMDVNSGTYQVIFDQAQQVKWNQDHTKAWVVFPSYSNTGEAGLQSAIYDPLTKTLTARVFVSERMIYKDPAVGDLIPSAWSHDGRWIVFSDSKGNVVLMNLDGSFQILGSGQRDFNTTEVVYDWSPDDQYLYVRYGFQGWFVTMNP